MKKTHFRTTNAIEKLSISAINTFIVFIFFLPFTTITIDIIYKKLIFVALFFIYNLVILTINNNKCVGMIILNLDWEKKYKLKNKILHRILYTLSFSTLLFHIYFPGDIFVINMLCIQLPCVILTKTTCHGYLSGKLTSIKLL